MQVRNTMLAAAGLATSLWALAPAAAAAAGDTANATLAGADGQEFGTVEVSETPNGLLVRLDAKGLPAGEHAFHLHATGKCEAPDFKSAGGHFNPGDAKHGILSDGGPHAGDMPNVTVGEDGTAKVDVFVEGVSLSGDNALMDDDGAAVVIHEGADDYKTDPAGDAGSRIACGVIEAASN